MTYPYGRDEWLVRSAAISTREYLFGYLSRHIPGSAIEALRRMPIQAAMVACVLDGDSVKKALARRDESFANFGLTIAIQHLNSSPYNLTKDECIELLRKVRGITRDDEITVERARGIARAALDKTTGGKS